MYASDLKTLKVETLGRLKAEAFLLGPVSPRHLRSRTVVAEVPRVSGLLPWFGF